MKYLQDYQDEKQTELFRRLGSFFAFSTKQFNEAKKEGVVYVNMGGGLITPKGTEAELIEALDSIHKESVEQDIKDNGISGIIERELYNHEAFYTGDIDSTWDELKQYQVITVDDIWKEYSRIRSSEKVKEM